MRVLLWILAVSGVFSMSVAVAGDVYKWTDADGRVHFGDRLPEGAPAQEIRIQSIDGPAEVTSAAGANAVDRSVTVYSTAWCGVCQKAKSYLKARGVPFTEVDIEKNSHGKAEFKRLGGKGVPLITVGNQRMSGFNSAKLDKLLKDAGLLKAAGG